MNNHTPTLDQVRGRYCDGTTMQTGQRTDGEEFDRAIEKVRAEAKAEALREAADKFDARAAKLVETTIGLPGQPGITEADIHRYGAYAAEAQNAAVVLTRMADKLTTL